MVLYNIVLGNLNLAPNPWMHIMDEHGNHFIAKDDIRQRIRIDENVDQATYPELGELTPVWASSNIQCYNILPGTRWINNNRNMNPLLLPNKEATSAQVVVYITVSNNYAITRFNTPYRILQTYHQKDTLQGCAVILNTEDITDNNKIISISVYDKKKDQYSWFNISFMKDDMDKIHIGRKAITDKAILETMQKQVKKFDNRYLGFKIITKPEELLTLTYVTSDKFKEEIYEATKNIKNVNIITFNPEHLNDENYVDGFVETFKSEFENNRIRAITQCGVSLPLDVVRKLKLLYVFNYDVTNKVLSCRKSN